jgi:hypothetical protein
VCHLTRPKSSMFHVQHFGICSVITGSRAAMWREGREGDARDRAVSGRTPSRSASPTLATPGDSPLHRPSNPHRPVPGARSGDFTVPQAVESPRPGVQARSGDLTGQRAVDGNRIGAKTFP